MLVRILSPQDQSTSIILAKKIQNHGHNQPRPQANSHYPCYRGRLGTKGDSEKAWHKMAKKSQFSEKKSQILLDKNLPFSARIREYFGCISKIHSCRTFRSIVDGRNEMRLPFSLAEVRHLASLVHFGFAVYCQASWASSPNWSFTADVTRQGRLGTRLGHNQDWFKVFLKG